MPLFLPLDLHPAKHIGGQEYHKKREGGQREDMKFIFFVFLPLVLLVFVALMLSGGCLCCTSVDSRCGKCFYRRFKKRRRKRWRK